MGNVLNELGNAGFDGRDTAESMARLLSMLRTGNNKVTEQLVSGIEDDLPVAAAAGTDADLSAASMIQIDSNTTMVATDRHIVFTLAMGGPSYTLLPAAQMTGKVIRFSSKFGAPLTIDPDGSESIDNTSSVQVTGGRTIVSDGTEWWTVGAEA